MSLFISIKNIYPLSTYHYFLNCLLWVTVEILECSFSTRDNCTRDTPNCLAASVTVMPSSGKISSRKILEGWGGLNIVTPNDNLDN